MQQYLDLLKTIKEKGTYKAPARIGMPGTTSLFGYQFRHNLQEGFPLLTTKKLSFKNIVVELLWFLKGDTNIKYLVDNGCNIWNEDAYNFYLKQFGRNPDGSYDIEPMSFEQFVDRIKNPQGESRVEHIGYSLGDTGNQYPWLWRHWGGSRKGPIFLVDSNTVPETFLNQSNEEIVKQLKEQGVKPTNPYKDGVDQIKELIKGLQTNPMSRRHIITAWNPETLNDMALNACHALVQFNCRPMSKIERLKEYEKSGNMISFLCEPSHEEIDAFGVPRYKLDCQMYQRSADVFLGVPYNIASYALLTHIIAKVCNMIPGEYIHTFGDVHIYDNHMEQVDEQLTRTPTELPEYKLEIITDNDEFLYTILEGGLDPNYLVRWLKNYNPRPSIKAKLSTGLQ